MKREIGFFHIAQHYKLVFSFWLDFETWKVTEKKTSDMRINVDEVADDFLQILDDKMKERFERHLRTAKQYGRERCLYISV